MSATKHKTPLKARTHSPGSYLLSPNNDDYEKAQARAARAAAQRRKSNVGLDTELAGHGPKPSSREEDILSKDQILDLYQNCIKLATENKINQRNTWELRLIDHLSEVIKGDDQEDTETNFQKASCTLEAGVKIYSYRVDSVHSEAFKVLGGLNRTATNDGDATGNDCDQDGEGEAEEESSNVKDNLRKTASCSTTLESSCDAINVKKFDVAFTVDPLFHQTSAQFDEGGAKGLLLNTLSVYNGCAVAFDSTDVPIKSMTLGNPWCTDMSATIDLSCMNDCFERLTVEMQTVPELSPTLKEIIKLLEDPYRAAAEAEVARHSADADGGSWLDDQISMNGEDGIGHVCDHNGPEHSDEEHDSGSFESFAGSSPNSVSWGSSAPGQEEDNTVHGESEVAEDDIITSEQTVDWLAAGLGLPSKSNAWAGSDHWKYKKIQFSAASNPNSEASAEINGKRIKKPKGEKFSLDFLNPPIINMAAFAPVPDPRSLLLPQSSSAASTLLPEDCHYQAEDLVRLYLQPSIMCINRKCRRKAGIARRRRRSNAFDRSSFGMEWNEDDNTISGIGVGLDDEMIHSDVDDPLDENLVPQPRKVQKVEVNYDKLSKQIDVRALKETLWGCLQEVPISEQELDDVLNPGVSFKSILKHIPTGYLEVQSSDISVHLCFICLLHLANEHGLCIKDCAALDELRIYNMKTDCVTSSEVTGN